LHIEKAVLEKVAVVHSGGYILIDGQEIKPYRVSQPSGNVYGAILTNENPMFPALMVSKHAIERIGYLDEKVVSYQEWDTSIRLAKFYKFAFIPEPTFIYDYRTQNAISRNYFREVMGYDYVVRKHFLPILIYAGPKALFNHYRIITSFHRKASIRRTSSMFQLRKTLSFLVLRLLGISCNLVETVSIKHRTH